MKLSSVALLICAVSVAPADCHSGYVFVSSPADKSVYYAKMLTAAEQATNQPMALKTLSDALERPLGLAVDASRGVLYVADPGKKAVVGFRVYEHPSEVGTGTLSHDAPMMVMHDIDAHWVAVNSVGTLFASDPNEGMIWTIPAENIQARLDGKKAEDAVRLYSQFQQVPIRMPQGLATDGWKLFWANGQDGAQVGTVIQGVEDTGGQQPLDTTQSMNKQSESAFGVCITSSRIYYTNRENNVFSIRADGSGRRVSVTDQLQEPRGCAYDGDGTVFVADRKMGKVFSFAGAAANLGSRIMTPVLEVADAYGVAAFPANSAHGLSSNKFFISLVLALGFLH